MTPAASLSLRPEHRFALQQEMSLLRLTAAEMAELLAEAAQENPHLRVTPPRRRFLSGGLSPAALERAAAPGPTGLHAHVAAELGPVLSRGDALSRVVAALMEELEPSGWIPADLGGVPARLGVSAGLVEAALKLVQTRISPAGLFARSLSECLALQLREQGPLDPQMEAVLAHLPWLEAEGPGGLARRAGLTPCVVRDRLALLRGLDPKPGARFGEDPAALRAPDAQVLREGGGWRLRFARGADPEVEIVPLAGGDAAMGAALKAARRLKSALELRRSAARQVVSALVGAQTGYLRRGLPGLRPLTMADLAARTGFHASTVGRVLHGFLLETPHGVVEAKTLCPGAVSRGAAGPGHCPAQVMARMREILAAEDPADPVSDGALAEALQAEGVAISRRVAAKYRCACGYPRAALRRAPG